MTYSNKVNEVKWEELVDENDDVGKKLKILLNKIEEAKKDVFENKAANKKMKHKIPKAIKKLYRTKSKVSKRIKRTRCRKKMVKLIEQLKEIDEKINKNKEEERYKYEKR